MNSPAKEMGQELEYVEKLSCWGEVNGADESVTQSVTLSTARQAATHREWLMRGLSSTLVARCTIAVALH